jgi:tRNA 2-thiouridine synthesizing protein A
LNDAFFDQLFYFISKKNTNGKKTMADQTLNCLGMKCPMPVLKAKSAINTLKSGQTLELTADDKGAKSDIPALLKKTGCSLVNLKEEGTKMIFLIKKD